VRRECGTLWAKHMVAPDITLVICLPVEFVPVCCVLRDIDSG
jgi:hypothetical protein